MSNLKRNEFLDHGFSDESSESDGYDSEAAEVGKGARHAITERSTKRRKLSHSGDEDDSDREVMTSRKFVNGSSAGDEQDDTHDLQDGTEDQQDDDDPSSQIDGEIHNHSDEEETDYKIKSASQALKPTKQQNLREKKHKAGVIYLSSLPPYLKPSALRNLLVQRGFEPITRLFLTPASKAKAGSKKNSRQLYTEGWIEFESKKMARRCAETLNATIVGGRKGGFYHDDLWNMKYLKGMGWDELMAGVREERREEEGRRDEERRVIARETKRFVEGVEEGKKFEGMKRKRLAKDGGGGTGKSDVKRTWNQFAVQGSGGRVKQKDKISDDVQEVLGQIF